jgi:homoserine dehydrogenase
VSGRHDVPFTGDRSLHYVPAGELWSLFYLSVDVLDRPGVLAEVASVFGRHDVSIQSMDQSGFGDEARLAFLTHKAQSANIEATVQELTALSSVEAVGACIRVIDEAVA